MNDGNDLSPAFRASGSQHPIFSEKERLLRFYEAQDARQPPPSASAQPPPTLAMFIAYALHRTRLHPSITFAALYLLQRLKTRFVAARGSSGHRLFILAFMITSKVICNDTYSNKSWCIVGQGMFALQINQMEREMCSYLEWQLNVDPSALKEFKAMVHRDSKGPGPYPSSYSLPAPASGLFAHPKPSTNPIVTTIPSFSPISQPLHHHPHRSLRCSQRHLHNLHGLHRLDSHPATHIHLHQVRPLLLPRPLPHLSRPPRRYPPSLLPTMRVTMRRFSRLQDPIQCKYPETTFPHLTTTCIRCCGSHRHQQYTPSPIPQMRNTRHPLKQRRRLRISTPLSLKPRNSWAV